MELIQSFNAFAEKENLFPSGADLLLAVSGGVDSVVLCELCQIVGLHFFIAHMNFQLRGEESDRDEQFVQNLGSKYNREVIVKRVDTRQYALENKISIQVAARLLRYEWFHSLVSVPGIAQDLSRRAGWIATAHHLDDNIETLLMNFFKGTGISGLRSILPKRGRVIRPLLFAWKDQLMEFALSRQLSWVHDSSNDLDQYSRNYFRHHIIPQIEKLYPQAIYNLSENIERFREIECLYKQAVDQYKKHLTEKKGNEIHVPILKLKKARPLPSILYEIIRDFNFSASQVKEVVDLLASPSGRYIQSSTHRIIKNRDWLIIASLNQEEDATLLIEENISELRRGIFHIRLSRQTASAPESYRTPEPNVGIFDLDQLQFPMILRNWRPGDYFYPLGLRKKKKIARFLIDQKMSRTDKEKVRVLEMDKKIIWVVGLRIDDRFKVNRRTKQVLKIKIEVGVT